MSFVVFTNDDYIIGTGVNSINSDAVDPEPPAIQRYFTQLDPVANAYYELETPITLTGDFEIEVWFSSTSVAASMNLISGTIVTEDTIILDFTSSNTIRAFAYVGTTLQPITSTSSLPYLDGKLRTAGIRYTGTTVELLVDGVVMSSGTWALNGNQNIAYSGARAGTTNYLDSILSNLKITDKSGAEDVTTTFALDSGKGVTTENSLENNNSLTRINVADEDIELFEKSGNQWGNISPLPQELPAVIQIAEQS